MKHIIFILPLLLLTGCSTKYVPVKMELPPIPSELNKECSELDLVNSNETKLSNVVKTVTANYGKYHECKARHKSTLEWYNSQKELMNK